MGRQTKIWAAVLTVVLVTVALAAGWSTGRLNPLICDGYCDASNATPPDGLRPVSVPPAPATPTVSAPDEDLVAAAVAGALDSGVLGDHVGFAAATAPGASEPWTTATSDDAFVPASATKLLTGFAALQELGVDTRFDTITVLDGSDLHLVGGGDPFLTDRRAEDDPRVWRADLATLAARTATALTDRGVDAVTLSYDATLFDGPPLSPSWPDTYVRDGVVSPIQPLWIDRGMVDPSNPEFTARVENSPAAAAQEFADLLRDEDVAVDDTVSAASAPDDRPPLASVSSSTVAQIVEAMLRTSDDEAAEVLLRHLGSAAGRDASFADGGGAVIDALDAAGIDTTDLRLADGSGLSRDNAITPTTLVQTLSAALSEPTFGAIAEGLPVSNHSGTLTERFTASTRGLVRGKTGTLTGVHSLSGIAYDADGRPVLFSVMADRADRTQPFAAQGAVDRIATAIAECTCGS